MNIFDDVQESHRESASSAALSFAQLENADFGSLFDEIAQRKFSVVILPLSLRNEQSQNKARAALHECKKRGFQARLKPDFAHIFAHIEYSNSALAGAPYLAYETHDVAAGFELSFDEATLASTLVPPGANGDLDWSKAQTFTENPRDFSPLHDASRLFMWQLKHDATRLFDPLDVAHVEAAISSTRSAWQNVVTPKLRDVVQGVSLKVPRFWDEFAPDATRRFPWTNQMATRFAALHGYEITENLSSLVADTGEKAVRVRQDFWQTISTLLRENFATPWGNWARAENVALQWRLCAAPLNRLVAFYGEPTAWLHDARDVVGEVVVEVARDAAIFGDAKNSSDTVLVRSLASLSSSLSLSASETKSHAPRITVAFETAPPLFEWHRFLLAGATAFEVDFSHTQQAESVAHAQLLQPYLARQIAVLQPEKSARVGVLWPSRSGWAHHHPKGHRLVRWVEEDLCDVADWLDDLHFDWRYVGESAIAQATIEDRVLDIRQSARPTPLLCCENAVLQTVVLPSVTCLSRAAWAKLEEFANAGGKIICLGLLPRWSEIGRDEELEKHLETQTRCTLEDVYAAYRREGREKNEIEMLAPSSVGYPILRQTTRGGRISTYQPRLNLDRDDARLRVRPIFTESLAPELESQSRGLRFTRRGGAGQNDFWLWNTRQETAKINVLLRAGNVAQIAHRNFWNASSSPCAVWMPLLEIEGGGAALSFEMAAGETRLFRVETTQNTSLENNEPHGESANFAVENYDEKTVRGLMQQSGVPTFGVRQNGKLRWFQGENVVVSSPLLLDDWEQQDSDSTHNEYSMSVEIPVSWCGCALRLEVAPFATNENVVEAHDGEQLLGRRFAPPLTFDVPTHQHEVALSLKLRVEAARDNAVVEAPLARLVAYPRVEIRVVETGENDE